MSISEGLRRMGVFIKEHAVQFSALVVSCGLTALALIFPPIAPVILIVAAGFFVGGLLILLDSILNDNYGERQALVNNDGNEVAANNDGNEVADNNDGNEVAANNDGNEVAANNGGNEVAANNDGNAVVANNPAVHPNIQLVPASAFAYNRYRVRGISLYSYDQVVRERAAAAGEEVYQAPGMSQ